MSYQIGMDTINLKPTPRLAHTEYCSNAKLIRAVTGGKPNANFNDLWETDLCWSVNDGPGPWKTGGRSTDMGHAEFLEGGVDKREAKPCPFHTAEDVLTFDAVKEYGLRPMPELVKYYEDSWQNAQKANPNQVFTAGYYNTIVSGAISAFGWDMLLTGAAYPRRFEKVLDSIFRLSLHHYTAWAQTTAPVFISHDDMVWSEGAFLHPDFYRQVIFPRYQRLWHVLRKAGKKVLFCSDGCWSEFVDDIAAAGADGFIFEPMTTLEPVVARYGKSHVIVSSKVDSRTLTFGNKAQIKAEIDATLKIAYGCPGFMFAVGNHIPSNIPVANGLFYFDYLRKHWRRK